eukprot:41830-Pelagomonas_calceolata.AAC.3
MSGRQCSGSARPSSQQQPSPRSLSAALPLTAATVVGHKQAGQQTERNGSMLRREGEQHYGQMSFFIGRRLSRAWGEGNK